MDQKSLINVKNASKQFKDNNGIVNKLFNELSFDIKENEFTSIIATTGVGKSTLLKVIAGLESLSEGTLEVNTTEKVVYIPSKPSSFPWMNVIENIKSVIPDSDVDINSIIKSVGLEGYENHNPDNRSFGFRFRISLARALACKPSVILLDEPFNEFSPESRKEIYELLHKIHSGTKISFVLSTTNISEALFLSDKIILLKGKPAVCADMVNCNFGSDKNLTLLTKPEFTDFRKRIEKVLVEDSETGFNEFKV